MPRHGGSNTPSNSLRLRVEVAFVSVVDTASSTLRLAESSLPCLSVLEIGSAPTKTVEVAKTWPADLIVVMRITGIRQGLVLMSLGEVRDEDIAGSGWLRVQ